MADEVQLTVTIEGRTLGAMFELDGDMERTEQKMQQLVRFGVILVRNKCLPARETD